LKARLDSYLFEALRVLRRRAARLFIANLIVQHVIVWDQALTPYDPK
jgi:hypothetical protein